MEQFVAAITLGILGSFHCIGMCGPIALALPVHREKPFRKTLLILSYNLGRIITYTMFGVMAGLIGESFVMAGYQRTLSIVIGILLLIGVIIPFTKHSNFFTGKIYFLFYRLKQTFAELFRSKGLPSLFMIGLLNGLLPCGLVYMSMAVAASTGDVFSGALFMGVFGLGTLPVMFTMPLLGKFITIGARNMMRKTMPVMITLIAVLLIFRGLNLGIPYVSPKFEAQTVSCHQTGHSHSQKNTIKCIGPASALKK